jgi:hypothetical protein
MSNTFSAVLPGCDITFTLNRLSLRKTNTVIAVVEQINKQGLQAFPKIKEALEVCVAGWSSDQPLSEIDDVLDPKQSLELIGLTLAGNRTNEDERKN